MTAEMVAPEWMHAQISAEQYDSRPGLERRPGLRRPPAGRAAHQPPSGRHRAKAGIPFCWRIEQAAAGVPIVYTYVLDPATKAYRIGEMFTGTVKATAPFTVTVELGDRMPTFNGNPAHSGINPASVKGLVNDLLKRVPVGLAPTGGTTVGIEPSPALPRRLVSQLLAETLLAVRLRQAVAGRLNRFGKVRGGELVTPRPV